MTLHASTEGLDEPLRVPTRVEVRPTQAAWKDYLELCKPRVVALMLLTSVVGVLLAPFEVFPWTAMILGNLGIALMAGGAAVINHVVDHQIDSLMARTRMRPVAQGKIAVTPIHFDLTDHGGLEALGEWQLEALLG